ncbi:four-carbon acid sugar kinase family protein [Azospirillum thermophilum]|uniref:Type III effector n=1 Tax=Azospirillum thermophilum TaxID=2202148 RepID=A0A2S2CZ54_9PROT|nr:four-carbon acid sugar kinase family protein [Azospirillum thermophilum]AWK89738.1 type III effector [Azospirillum thermophilum]
MASASTQSTPLLLTFYGDDFTGSTDAMEAVAMAGIPTMLFLEPPTREDLARYPAVRVVGVAGTSRSRPPEWMDRELPAVFERLKALGAPYCHYKTCSTFDSSPTVGNIGRVAEIGRRVFGSPALVVVGVARHKRFVMFSTLFAAGSFSGNQEVYRIDRHPTMSRHPVTPMQEADLRLHLARQTDSRIVGFDFLRMLAEDADRALDAVIAEGAELVVLDTFDAATTLAAGRLMAHRAAAAPVFLVGSSGVEYALTEHLARSGALPRQPIPAARGPVGRILSVCGSCSPITEGQIAWAAGNGFAPLALDTVALIGGTDEGPLKAALTAQVLAALDGHKGVLLHTARGPGDPRIEATRAALERRGLTGFDSSRILGGILGRALRDIVAATGIGRVALAGGDSSSHTAQAMGIDALEVAGPLVPGAPLCRVHSRDAVIDGMEIVFKGGQVGGADFFARVLAGC